MLRWLLNLFASPLGERRILRRVIRARYDAAVTSDDNRRHWANVSGGLRLSQLGCFSAGRSSSRRNRLALTLPPETVRSYNDGPEFPTTPLLMQAEQAYRDGFRSIAMTTRHWKGPPEDLRKALWRDRGKARRKAEVFVPSSVMYGNPDLDSEQIVYRVDHEVAASSHRGYVQAFELAARCWEELSDLNVPGESICSIVLRPWSDAVLAWSTEAINPRKIVPPPRPEEFIPSPSRHDDEPSPMKRDTDIQVEVAPASLTASTSEPKRPEAIIPRLTDVERE